MRALLLAALIAAAPVAPALAQNTTQAAQADHAIDVERVVSPGGIEAWLVSDSTVPMIVLKAYWAGGAAGEPADQVGLTSMMADMLTEGAGPYDSNAFKQRLEELNMGLSFASGGDGVWMSLTTLSENRDAAFEMARLALAEPRFDAAALARLQRQMLVGIRQRETNPGYLAWEAMDQALYPGHPYAARTSREGVQSVTRAHLRARWGQVFGRDRMMVTIVGDIDAESAARLLDQTFASEPASAPPALMADAELQPPTPLIVSALPQPQSLIL
jgi:zinc protease